MTPQQLRQAVVDALRSVAPEADPASLDDGTRLRAELDLDSLDFLRVVTELHTRLQVDIPEADYPRIQTLGSLIGYLQARLPPGAPA